MPRRTLIALLALLLTALMLLPAPAGAQDAPDGVEYDDDTTVYVLPAEAQAANATYGQQYNTRCWRPSPSHHSRCFRHDHRVETTGSGTGLQWRAWVAVAAWVNTYPTQFIRYNIQHLTFCSHYNDQVASAYGTHNCADMAGRSNLLGWTYYTGSWRTYNSGNSPWHATSSGCVGSDSADGIRVRFEPGASTEHLTHWYFGSSAWVDTNGTIQVASWNCLVPA